ncbi:hypothetical protein [Salinigranum halophilum]|jgi:hypothetical protein|uniref:hypothetical protein n=1 Tax=Salinigranum halophilum TaxID=2565931 RepID=UPI001F33720E|nr:hypothetical protein [Salinigranum halophilum]
MSQTATGRENRPKAATLEAIPPIERTLENGTLRLTRRFRGLTIEQAMRYLEHLGGARQRTRTVSGDGWEAHLSQRKVPVGPSYRLTEVTVTWVGDPDVVDPLVAQFRRKAFRAPG